MNRDLDRAHLAANVALIGSGLGMVAGLAQATVGARIPEWTGHKNSPVALGLLTIVLSAVSLLCALRLRRGTEGSAGPAVALAIGLLVPGLLCFSTVGVLWYGPGLLLLGAGAYEIAAIGLPQTRAVIAANWLAGLVSVLGGFELLMAISAGAAVSLVVGVIGGIALVAALWLPTVRLRVAFLLIGALPFATLTWWSLVTPLVAVLALAIGLTTVRQHPR